MANGLNDLRKLIETLDRENPDGYSIAEDGGVELQFSDAILVIHTDGSWELLLF
jgi:hypothetical protein